MHRWITIFFCPLLWMTVSASEVALVESGVMRSGDDPSWAASDVDVSDWTRVHWADVREREAWWYRGEVDLTSFDPDTPLALYVYAVASAEVFWDGVPLGANGRPGDASTEIPGRLHARFAIPSAAATPGRHMVALRVSAQHAWDGIDTPVDAVFVAPYGPPLAAIRDHYLPSVFVGGVLVLAAVVAWGMWWMTRRRTTGWLALATAAAVLQLAAEALRGFVNYPYTWHGWRLFAISVLAAILSGAVIGYCAERFASPRAKGALLGGYAFVAVLAIALWHGNDVVTFGVILVALLTAFVLALTGWRQGQRGAGVVMIGVGVALATMLIQPMTFLDRTLFVVMAVLLAIFLFDHARESVRVTRERDLAKLRSATLEAALLKRHLGPHFLLNSLTLVTEWLETDPASATRFINALAEEFRLVNAAMESDLITLDQELALCRAHLKVMGMRFETSYGLRLHDPQSRARALRLPPATLHTLLENALSHNHYDGHVEFEVLVQDTEPLRIEFRAPLGTDREAPSSGFGLKYVRERLQNCFGSRAEITSRRETDCWSTQLTLPKSSEVHGIA